MFYGRFYLAGAARNLHVGYKRLTLSKKIATWAILICFLYLLTYSPSPRAFIFSSPLRIGQENWRHPLSKPFFDSSRDLQITRDPKIWEKRRLHAREAFSHAYSGYREYAFGADELFPRTNQSKDNLNGWGLTIVDSLDTMALMEFHEEFEEGVRFVETTVFNKHNGRWIPFFETVIRYLGGYLSGYYLASTSSIPMHRDTLAPILLRKADELGEILLTTFNTKSGLPEFGITYRDGKYTDKGGGSTSLAEMASCQVEYKYLAHLTGNPEYFTKTEKVMELMEKHQGKTLRVETTLDSGVSTMVLSDERSGLWSNHWFTVDGSMSGFQVSIGAAGDSGYEYLLKQYLLSGRREKRMLSMYLKSVDGVLDRLLYLSKKRKLLYVTDIGSTGVPSGRMEHLSCFLPGVLALGARLLHPDYPWQTSNRTLYPRYPKPSSTLPGRLELHMRAAIGLGYTCWKMYDDTESGMGPESILFQPNLDENGRRLGFDGLRWREKVQEWERRGRKGALVGTEGWPEGGLDESDYMIRDTRHLLRPEAIEAMYILWRTTGDPVWRERGWKMIESVLKHTRTESGYTVIQSVQLDTDHLLNEMPSFFLAETLKYSYLLTLTDDPFPLDQFVFNTEAHPLPMFDWSLEEIRKYSILT